MELEKTLTMISTVIGIIVGLMTISEKISKVNFLGIFPDETKTDIKTWILFTIIFSFGASIFYWYQFTSGSSVKTISFLLCFIPWIGLLTAIYVKRAVSFEKADFSSPSFWKFIIFSSIGSIIISFFAFTFIHYFVIAITIVSVIYLLASLFLGFNIRV